MVESRLAARHRTLVADRTPFVHATVVRAQCPTSARPGDSALVTADGSIEGFIGGQCAEGSVRAAALGVLESGDPLLLRILPDDDTEFPESEGARTVVNPCLSGGALEIFLEPQLPAPLIAITGNTPIAEALAEMAEHMGYAVTHERHGSAVATGATAVVVSSHGRHEPEALKLALDAGVQFIGLVASQRRGASVVDELGLTADERGLIRTPVGLDIGARTAEEIALSIMAEIVTAVRRDGLRAAPAGEVDRPREAVDPVCGMTVLVDSDTPHLRLGGVDHWFCNPGCRDRYATERAS